MEIFHYFQYFERFWQISKPKIVDWYLDFSKDSYTTLKSIISSFKICFQNYGKLKRKFLRPKKTTSTFLKFELSRLSGPMLKTQKNAIRNQFEQHWFNVISYQKPPRVYRTNLIKFKAVLRQEKQSLAKKKRKEKPPTPINSVILKKSCKALKVPKRNQDFCS